MGQTRSVPQGEVAIKKPVKDIRVAICVLTYKRPKGLRRLLAGLGELKFNGDPPGIEIVVIGNDADGSGEPVCSRAEKKSPWPIRYCIEQRRGISSGRNKALSEALPGNDFIVFIDDDLVPHSWWLNELLAIQRLYRADVVTGPVLPRFIETPPAWVTRGRNFQPWRYPVGRQVEVAYTSNVMARTAVFRETGLQFDVRLDLTGGEDHLLFRRVSAAGYKIIWADRALVYAWIPANRTTVGWVLRRSFSVGNSLAYTRLDMQPEVSTAVKLFGWGCAWTMLGTGTAVSGMVRGAHATVSGARLCSLGAGIIAGIVGLPYQEYRVTDGE